MFALKFPFGRLLVLTALLGLVSMTMLGQGMPRRKSTPEAEAAARQRRIENEDATRTIYLPAMKIALIEIGSDPCGTLQRIEAIRDDFRQRTGGRFAEDFQYTASEACKASQTHMKGISRFEMLVLAGSFKSDSFGYIDLCSYDKNNLYEAELNLVRATVSDYSGVIRGNARGSLASDLRENPCLKAFILAGLTGQEFKPPVAPKSTPIVSTPKSAAVAPPPFVSIPSAEIGIAASSVTQQGISLPVAEGTESTAVSSLPSEPKQPHVVPPPSAVVRTVPGPRSGRLEYNGTPVPQNGEIVFSGIPAGKLRLDYDRSAWVAIIALGDDNTQRIILRSLKSGTQKKAWLIWVLE